MKKYLKSLVVVTVLIQSSVSLAKVNKVKLTEDVELNLGQRWHELSSIRPLEKVQNNAQLAKACSANISFPIPLNYLVSKNWDKILKTLSEKGYELVSADRNSRFRYFINLNHGFKGWGNPYLLSNGSKAYYDEDQSKLTIHDMRDIVDTYQTRSSGYVTFDANVYEGKIVDEVYGTGYGKMSYVHKYSGAVRGPNTLAIHYWKKNKYIYKWETSINSILEMLQNMKSCSEV